MRGVAHLHQLMIDAGGTVGLVEMDGGSVADEKGVGGRLTRSRRKAEEQGVGACGIAQRQLEGLHADGFVEQDGIFASGNTDGEAVLEGERLPRTGIVKATPLWGRPFFISLLY